MDFTQLKDNGLSDSANHISSRRRSNSNVTTSATKEMKGRGQLHSSLVSAKLSNSIVHHWFVRLCRIGLKTWGRFVRALTVTDSVLAAILRAGNAIAVFMTIMLAIISVSCVLQRNGKYYVPLLRYEKVNDAEFKFDHIISNVSLYLHDSTCNSINITNEQFDKRVPKTPVYSACEIVWKGGGRYYRQNEPPLKSPPSLDNGMTVLDLAILSEIAYVDDLSVDFSYTQTIIDDLFPGLGFHVNVAPRRDTEGPKFIEIESELLGMIIISVRGTDVSYFLPQCAFRDVLFYTSPVDCMIYLKMLLYIQNQFCIIFSLLFFRL
jgi:hypothetical protein